MIGQAAPERVAGGLVGGVEDEVDDFDGGVDDAEGFGLFAEAQPEELFVELGDDLLFAVGGGDLGGADPHRGVEPFELDGFGFQAGAVEGVDHGLHDAGDRVVGGEVVLGEQGVEDGFGDQMLGQHADRVLTADGVVEVVAQALDELLELRGHLGGGAGEQGADAGDEGVGDVGDVGGPVFPVGAGADLVDDARHDRFLPFRQGEQRHLLRHPSTVIGRRASVPVGVAVVGGAVGEGFVVVGDGPDVPAHQHVAAFAGFLDVAAGVEGDGVDHRVEPVVVGAQGVEDLPDHLETGVVRQRLRG